MKKLRMALVLAAAMLTALPAAQAGVIEDLLALPAIQSLLGRIPELDPLIKRCDDISYKQRNLELCQQVAQAAQLAKMPPELRAVMATPPAAASLRELCIAAIGQPAYNGYLCQELYKFDETFKAQSLRIHQENLMNRQMR
jgi:hypothetical protein